MAIIRIRQTRREMFSGVARLAGATLLSRQLLLGDQYAPKLSVEIYIWIQHLESEKKTLAEGVQEVLASFHGAGYRRVELHLRNSRQGIWMEDFGPGDIDYQKIADYVRDISFNGYLVVELAYEKGTEVTRSLDKDLRLSRLFTERVFGLLVS